MSTLSHALRIASKLPVGDPTRRTMLAHIRESTEKTAAFDFPDAIFKVIRQADARRRAVVEVAIVRSIDKLEKELIKQDFVLDRRKTYVHDYYHHEGTRFEGKLAFVDKRDHMPRNKNEVVQILQKAVGIWGYPTQDSAGVWVTSVGE